ncbi:MAG TPA: hypothetical protein DIC35_03645 [Candidatus Moranbacteria bacterium]|nr:hypothetical protein [Candidatus Moranbacteria bacterium]
MLVAIISDIHNNEVNLKKVLDYCHTQKIKNIVCCGDLASQETLDFLNDNFSGEIFYTFGNMDNEHLRNFKFVEKYKNTKLFRNFGETEINGKKIAFIHYPEEAKELCGTGKYDFVFYGHTHKPWEEVIALHSSAKASGRQCKILNPGNVAGEIYPPTFAVWNTENDQFELIRIHNLE